MAIVKKTIMQLRDNCIKVFKSKRPNQIKKLMKAYHGKRLKKLWSERASFEEITIAQCKEYEGVGNRMKGGHTPRRLR